MAAADSCVFMQKLQEALGLADRPIARLVIVCELDEPAQVFIKEIMQDESISPAAEALAEFRESLAVESVADVVVDDNGNVFVEEKANGVYPTNP